MVLVPQLIVEVSECIVVKLFAIVKDEDPRDPKLADDALLDEVTDILLYDGCQWFCLYPLGEVVDPHKKELESSYCHWRRSYDVQSPLSERPRGVNQGEWF